MIRRYYSCMLAVVLLAVLAACGGSEPENAADLIVTNGVIYTVDDQFSVAEAMAIADGHILAVGAKSDIEAYKTDTTRVIDAGGKPVLPGLIDAHAHLIGYSVTLDQLNLAGTESVEVILAIVREKAEELEPGVWITGRGWDQNDWPVKEFPTAAMLDVAAPDNPVMLRRVDGHAAWVNSAAMAIAGLDAETETPSGGEIIKENGTPTGVLIDSAMGIVSQHIPEVDEARVEALLKQAVVNMHQAGLVGNHEMGGSTRITDLMKKLIDAGEFNYRVVMYYSSGLENIEDLMANEVDVYGGHQLVIGGMKAYADGALGSRGAAMLEPYSDRPDTRGLIIDDEDRLTELATIALENGKQIVTHAIGDRGNRVVLNAYQRALNESTYDDHRLRIEHAQIIHPDDIPRFAELGVVPSMQPTHCTSDFPWAFDRIGDERANGAYAWRTLIDDGNYIPCGSDFPVEEINPFDGIYSAITRQHQDGTPENGYLPEERMTREEALRGFTIWAAKAAFMEEVAGSLEPGKLADFIIVDRDIMNIDPMEIPDTVVLKTVVNGNVVYELPN